MPENAVVTIPREEIQLLRSEGTAVIVSIHVIDDATCKLASDVLKGRAEWKKKVVERFKPIKKAADSVHQMVVDLEKEVLATGQQQEDVIRNARDKFVKDAQAEVDRKKREAAELQRKQEEAARKIREEELFLARELEGEEAAQEIAQKPLPVPAPTPIIEKPVLPSGTFSRETWKWKPTISEPVSIMAIVDAIYFAQDPNYRKTLCGFLVLNEKNLNTESKKHELASAPGITFYSESKIVDRS